MLKPCPAEEMEAYPVSTVVNNPRNETEKCVEAVRTARQEGDIC